MRLLFPIWIFLLTLNAAGAQDKIPKIVGQKELSTLQAQPITIRLTDLYVEEHEEKDDENNDDDKGEDENKDNEGNDDDEEGEKDNDGNDDDKGAGEKDDKDNKGDKDDKGDKGKNDKGDKDKDKEDKGDKGDKNKGNGNGRTMAYPEGYTLEIFSGNNYTFSGATVTPDPDFTGVLIVKVRVRNKQHASAKHDLKITVIPANKRPVITGQVPLTTQENTPLTIKLADLKVEDPDDQYPQGFTLSLTPGNHYQVNQTTITPGPGFTGTLSVPVVVNDGELNSEPFNLTITVSGSPNIAPQITGQIPLTISENQSLVIALSHLLVTDPDNKYPGDFTLKLYPGDHYTLNGFSLIPEDYFKGDLMVKVSVRDRSRESNIYNLKITVIPSANQKPIITGQAGIKITEGQSLEIKFSHLVVEDADNQYPEDFTLAVSAGDYYGVDNHVIKPIEGYLGILTVKVTVHDGTVSSDPFDLIVEVVPNDRLEIVGQQSVKIAEDSTVRLGPLHLIVSDPSNTFPEGFDIHALEGENYEVASGIIKPHRDFFGNLTVPVMVSNSGTTSAAFNLLIVVTPVNDPPEFMNMITEPLLIYGNGPWTISPGLQIADVDDDHLLFAEIGFQPDGYQRGIDQIEFESSDSIHTVFDRDKGVLYLLGRVAVENYQRLLQSLTYNYDNTSDSLPSGTKTIYIKVNDGKASSSLYERILMMETNIALEIPSAFTPNNDQANDTWKITLQRHIDQISALIRVYDKKGNKVFEAAGLEREWDGHFKGSPLPADVYFYTIEMNHSNKKVNYKGIVSILR